MSNAIKYTKPGGKVDYIVEQTDIGNNRVFYTANAFDEDRKNAYNAGMNAHLSKPIDVALLAKTLRQFL